MNMRDFRDTKITRHSHCLVPIIDCREREYVLKYFLNWIFKRGKVEREFQGKGTK